VVQRVFCLTLLTILSFFDPPCAAGKTPSSLPPFPLSNLLPSGSPFLLSVFVLRSYELFQMSVTSLFPVMRWVFTLFLSTECSSTLLRRRLNLSRDYGYPAFVATSIRSLRGSPFISPPPMGISTSKMGVLDCFEIPRYLFWVLLSLPI